MRSIVSTIICWASAIGTVVHGGCQRSKALTLPSRISDTVRFRPLSPTIAAASRGPMIDERSGGRSTDARLR